MIALIIQPSPMSLSARMLHLFQKMNQPITSLISVLSTVSKLFERNTDKQIAAYITPFLSSLLCGFRKGYSAQLALLRLLEKFKIALMRVVRQGPY